jgi:hypothetical protein
VFVPDNWIGDYLIIIRLILFPRVSDEHESFMCAKACDLGLALV